MNGGTFTQGKEKNVPGSILTLKQPPRSGYRSVNAGLSPFPSHPAGEAKTFVSISSIEDLNKKWGSVLKIRH